MRRPLPLIYSAHRFCWRAPGILPSAGSEGLSMRLYPKVIPIISRECIQIMMQDGDIEVEPMREPALVILSTWRFGGVPQETRS